jgi:hypothetical protein
MNQKYKPDEVFFLLAFFFSDLEIGAAYVSETLANVRRAPWLHIAKVTLFTVTTTITENIT